MDKSVTYKTDTEGRREVAVCLCVWGEEAAGQPQSDVAEPRPELSLDTSLVVCVTLDRSLCLSELQPEGSFTNKCKSGHIPLLSHPSATPRIAPTVLKALPVPAPPTSQLQPHKPSNSTKAPRPLCTLICLGCPSSS